MCSAAVSLEAVVRFNKNVLPHHSHLPQKLPPSWKLDWVGVSQETSFQASHLHSTNLWLADFKNVDYFQRSFSVNTCTLGRISTVEAWFAFATLLQMTICMQWPYRALKIVGVWGMVKFLEYYNLNCSFSFKTEQNFITNWFGYLKVKS